MFEISRAYCNKAIQMRQTRTKAAKTWYSKKHEGSKKLKWYELTKVMEEGRQGTIDWYFVDAGEETSQSWKVESDSPELDIRCIRRNFMSVRPENLLNISILKLQSCAGNDN